MQDSDGSKGKFLNHRDWAGHLAALPQAAASDICGNAGRTWISDGAAQSVTWAVASEEVGNETLDAEISLGR